MAQPYGSYGSQRSSDTDSCTPSWTPVTYGNFASLPITVVELIFSKIPFHELRTRVVLTSRTFKVFAEMGLRYHVKAWGIQIFLACHPYVLMHEEWNAMEVQIRSSELHWKVLIPFVESKVRCLEQTIATVFSMQELRARKISELRVTDGVFVREIGKTVEFLRSAKFLIENPQPRKPQEIYLFARYLLEQGHLGTAEDLSRTYKQVLDQDFEAELRSKLAAQAASFYLQRGEIESAEDATVFLDSHQTLRARYLCLEKFLPLPLPSSLLCSTARFCCSLPDGLEAARAYARLCKDFIQRGKFTEVVQLVREVLPPLTAGGEDPIVGLTRCLASFEKGIAFMFVQKIISPLLKEQCYYTLLQAYPLGTIGVVDDLLECLDHLTQPQYFVPALRLCLDLLKQRAQIREHVPDTLLRQIRFLMKTLAPTKKEEIDETLKRFVVRLKQKSHVSFANQLTPTRKRSLQFAEAKIRYALPKKPKKLTLQFESG